MRCRALWFRVLELAFREAIAAANGSRDARKRKNQAIKWFECASTEVGSFLWVCEQLEFSATKRLQVAVTSPTSGDGKRARKAFQYYFNGGGRKRHNGHKPRAKS